MLQTSGCFDPPCQPRPVSIDLVLSAHHGVAPRAAFLAAGVTSYALGRARHEGRLLRVRRAWFAEPTADPRIVTAVRIGGALTCHSVLERHGLWVLPDERIHVSVPANAGRLRSAKSARIPLAAEPGGAVVHWRRPAGEVLHPIDDLATSLAHYATCASPEFALVAIDCALNRSLVTVGMLEAAFVGLPERCRALLLRADSSSQSGLETLSRDRLRRHRVRVRTQVRIRGVGRVDVLIGDRLVLELDGYGFHATGEAFETDRRRDLALHALGYRVVRLSYRQVMEGWDGAEQVILSMIRRGDHRWPRHRSA